VRDWPEPKNALGNILNSPYTFNHMNPQIDLTGTALILVNVQVKAHCHQLMFYILYHLPLVMKCSSRFMVLQKAHFSLCFTLQE
jgi:hypothetical protein